MAKKQTDVVNEELRQSNPLKMDELGERQPIEQVSERDFVKKAELESFMEDVLTIYIHPGNEKRNGDLPVISPAVNGINQPMIRGRNIQVKRKYVEALARSVFTDFESHVSQNHKGEFFAEQIPTNSMAYQFSVLSDPHPNGPAWLDSIMREAH